MPEVHEAGVHHILWDASTSSHGYVCQMMWILQKPQIWIMETNKENYKKKKKSQGPALSSVVSFL